MALDKTYFLSELAVARGFLTREQVDTVLKNVDREAGKFIDTAVALGYVTQEQAEKFKQQTDRVLAASTVAPAPAAVDSDLPDEVATALRFPERDIGRYILVTKLGLGAEGSVWRAWQKDLRRFVAVKFLERTGAHEADRFRRGALALAKLDHPNIAQVFETGVYDGKPFLVMPCIDGQTVDELNLTPTQVARIIRLIALALHAAHQQGIVHRDIKPSNIMIDRQRRLFVMDFGLAKPLDNTSRLTAAGSILGSPGYMSPEQARGETVDARTDIYSLGATAYRLLCHCPPQEGNNIFEVLEKIEKQPPTPPTKLNPQVSADLEAIVLKCLSKNKDDRYATAMEMAEDLQRLLNDLPVRARRPGKKQH